MYIYHSGCVINLYLMTMFHTGKSEEKIHELKFQFKCHRPVSTQGNGLHSQEQVALIV